MVEEIPAASLKTLLDGPSPPLLLDVREPWERDIARVAGSLDIPMAEVPQRLSELARDRSIVVMCRSGGRSLKVARYLEAQGFPRVANLTGGILAWAEQVDPSLRTY